MSTILPLLFAKSWAIGYVIVALGVVLGLVGIVRPVKRKLHEVSPNFKAGR